MDLNIIVGGPQGGGIETAGLLAIRACANQGLEVFAAREYHSNIKGKHSYSHIRTSDKEIGSIKYPVDALGVLDAESLATHFKELKKGGLLVHDIALASKSLLKIPSMEKEKAHRLRKDLEENKVGESVAQLDDWLSKKGIRVLSLPFSKLLVEADVATPLIDKTMNTAVIGALLHSMGIKQNALEGAVSHLFSNKKEVLEANLRAIQRVCALTKPLDGYIEGKGDRANRYLVAGNDAVAIGKLLGGLRLQTYYPITPAADESFILEQATEIYGPNGKLLGPPLVIQAEDEIAAVTMAIGGALTGARAATSTSGPGFSLMIEALGWAGNCEVPLVITMYQRGGPSTGLPTRNSQSDLMFAIYGGHGEFARIVLASGDHSEAACDAIKCMNYAEEFQVPVIHLLDKGIANCVTTIKEIPMVTINRGTRSTRPEGEYKRFKFTSSGISPRAFLGEALMWYTGDEHDEWGHISEDSINRIQMYRKRIEKSRLILSRVPEEDKAVLFGSENYDDLIITWGICKGAVVDALDSINESDRKVAVLQVRMMEPFPSEIVRKFTRRASRLISVEGNYMGMLAELVEGKCKVDIPNRILKFTGRLISEDEVVHAYKRLKDEPRIILDGGE